MKIAPSPRYVKPRLCEVRGGDSDYGFRPFADTSYGLEDPLANVDPIKVEGYPTYSPQRPFSVSAEAFSEGAPECFRGPLGIGAKVRVRE